MILYKYVSFNVGKTILQDSKIGFSQSKYFNDPFDTPSYPEEYAENSAYGIFSGLNLILKNSAWAMNTGILSLTRTPTNPLMWAHYADSHKGMVIGIDAVAAGFTNEKTNLVPSQYGSVIYVSRQNNDPFISKPKNGIAVGATHHFPHEHYEKLQRLFLHKPICWSYEEEVRVAKCLDGISNKNKQTVSGEFDIIQLEENRPLYVLSLSPGAIKEVYFGIKSDLEESDNLYYAANELHQNLSVYECSLDIGDLSVGFDKYVTIAESQE